MDLELKGKVAIVGGASKGLGRACADVLAEEGARVAVCSRTSAALERAAQEIRDRTGADVLALAGDLDRPTRWVHDDIDVEGLGGLAETDDIARRLAGRLASAPTA
jgi:short-subunit dehydrogenase